MIDENITMIHLMKKPTITMMYIKS